MIVTRAVSVNRDLLPLWKLFPRQFIRHDVSYYALSGDMPGGRLSDHLGRVGCQKLSPEMILRVLSAIESLIIPRFSVEGRVSV